MKILVRLYVVIRSFLSMKFLSELCTDGSTLYVFIFILTKQTHYKYIYVLYTVQKLTREVCILI